MFNAKHATLFFLITYHWHASLAVSTWPSGRLGIVAEVNGSPTDAWLNIPVVKRSSNQAELANELLPPRHSVVVRSNRQKELDEFLAFGYSHPTDREYANRTLEKSTEPIIQIEESRKMMFESMLDHDYVKKWNEERTASKNDTIEVNGKDREKLRSDGNPWFDNERTLTSTGQRREKLKNDTGPSHSAFIDVAKMYSIEEIAKRADGKNETIINETAMNETGIFDSSGAIDEDSSVLSKRSTRGVLLSNIERMDSVGTKLRKLNKNDEKMFLDYDTITLPSGSSLLPTTESLDHINRFEKNKQNIAGVRTSNSLGIAKLLASSRLHQQSRNTKPRTIVQHLRDVNGQTQSRDNSPRLFRSTEVYNGKFGNAESRSPKQEFSKSAKNRRQSTHYQNSNLFETHGNPNQLRFIPFYNDRNKFLIPFGFQGPNENTVNEMVTFSENGELTQRNITDLSSFDEGQIENLSKSLDNVFDSHLLAEQRYELPNVRAILPNHVFIIPPRLIYDTKILPSPFSFDKYYANYANTVSVNNDNNNNLKKINNPGLSVKGVFDGKEMDSNLQKKPTIPSRENTRESVTSLENFVTPLPSRVGQVSFGVNQPEVPLVSTLQDEKYRVREPEKMENPSRVREYETLQQDRDEPRVNHKSPSETGVEDHSTNIRSSYDNSKSTYANTDKSGMGNVEHLTITKVINDEHANRQTARYGHQESNMKSGVQMGTLRIPGGQRDVNYDGDSNRWREKDDNNHMRYVAKYSFGYLVNDDKSQNDFGHHEMRDEGITKGRYHVKLPDGRIQKVNYHVDENGYHAIVTYRRDDNQ